LEKVLAIMIDLNQKFDSLLSADYIGTTQ